MINREELKELVRTAPTKQATVAPLRAELAEGLKHLRALKHRHDELVDELQPRSRRPAKRWLRAARGAPDEGVVEAQRESDVKAPTNPAEETTPSAETTKTFEPPQEAEPELSQ